MADLPSYGLEWKGPTEPVAVPKPDGYWTPWHLANTEIDRLRAALERIADHDCEGERLGFECSTCTVCIARAALAGFVPIEDAIERRNARRAEPASVALPEPRRTTF